MSEIKFACPHCAQHVSYVAGDSGDADTFIVCPGCGKPMPVPVTSAADTAPPKSRLATTTPASRRKSPPPIPKRDPATEEEWEAQVSALSAEPRDQMPQWVYTVIFIIAAPFLLLGLLFLGCSVCGKL